MLLSLRAVFFVVGWLSLTLLMLVSPEAAPRVLCLLAAELMVVLGLSCSLCAGRCPGCSQPHARARARVCVCVGLAC